MLEKLGTQAMSATLDVDLIEIFPKAKTINLNNSNKRKAHKFHAKVISSMILLHFFGLGDVLRRFELEQITGLTIMGFRPLSLDELMHWSQNMADQHHWDGEAIRHDVMSTWLDHSRRHHPLEASAESGPC